MKKIIEYDNQETILQEGDGDTSYEYVVKRNAQLTLLAVLGSETQKEVRLVIRLSEPGASAKIIGLVLGDGKDKVSLHTLQIHEAPETKSNLLVKGVLTDQAVFNYEGTIRVEPSAQKTDAYQRNENLLLSDKARAESKPTLEILANDVRCTHGATVGTVDPAQLWYLASRGIDKKQGNAMIARGFLESAILAIPDTIKESITERILAFL